MQLKSIRLVQTSVFFFDVYAFRTPRKSYRFEYLRFVQLFKSLYLFLEKELEEKSTGEIEYLGEVHFFSAAPQPKKGRKEEFVIDFV